MTKKILGWSAAVLALGLIGAYGSEGALLTAIASAIAFAFVAGVVQSAKASEKENSDSKNTSEAKDVKEVAKPSPAVASEKAVPAAEEAAPAAKAAETGKDAPVNLSPVREVKEKASPGLPEITSWEPRKPRKAERPAGVTDVCHDWPGVSEILAESQAWLRQNKVRGGWVSTADLEASWQRVVGHYDVAAAEKALAAATPGQASLAKVLGGLSRQAAMASHALGARKLALSAASQLLEDNALQGLLDRVQSALDTVEEAATLADAARVAAGVPDLVWSHCELRHETEFGVEESITFARKVIDKFAGSSTKPKDAGEVEKTKPASTPRPRHKRPSLGDTVKDTPKNQGNAPGTTNAGSSEEPTLGDAFPELNTLG